MSASQISSTYVCGTRCSAVLLDKQDDGASDIETDCLKAVDIYLEYSNGTASVIPIEPL